MCHSKCYEFRQNTSGEDLFRKQIMNLITVMRLPPRPTDNCPCDRVEGNESRAINVEAGAMHDYVFCYKRGASVTDRQGGGEGEGNGIGCSPARQHRGSSRGFFGLIRYFAR